MFLFKKVTIDNFRSIGHIELDLDNQGLVLVEGINNTNQTYLSNGSGKSTMLSAIPWALYDITPEGAKADDVINNKIGKDTSVILEFEIDGLPYRIERYRKHKKYKNKVLLFQGDTDLTQSTVAQTNKKILELFGIDLNTFLNSIMYGQGDVEIFAKASDKGKKEILENIANISIYQDAQVIAKEKLAEVKLKQTIKNNELESLQVKLGDLHYQEKTEAETYKKTADLIKHQTQVIENLTTEYANKENAHKAKLEDIKFREGQLNAELSDIVEPPAPQELTEEYNAFNAQIIQLETLYNTKNQEILALQHSMEQLGTSDTCYVCGSPLDVTHRELERERITASISEIQTSIQPVVQALPVYKQQLSDKKTELDNIYYTINDINVKKQELQSSLMNINHEKQTVGGELVSLEQQINSSKEQLANLESLPKPAKRTKEKKEVQKNIDSLVSELSDIVDDIEEYDTIINKVFSNKGIRSHVLDLTTPFLNEKANGYLATLSGSDININLATQKENKDGSMAESFNLQVSNGSGGEEYKTNSAGERKRIDLAIALAIQDLIFSKSNLATNLVVYDECFDGLDSIGCENVIEILKDKQKTVGSIFVITHNENLKSLFENIITVEKVDGVTSLVTGGKNNEN